jgi:hypothetical protein
MVVQKTEDRGQKTEDRVQKTAQTELEEFLCPEVIPWKKPEILA